MCNINVSIISLIQRLNSTTLSTKLSHPTGNIDIKDKITFYGINLRFAKGFGGPSTDGFSLNSDLVVCGGDEPVTVRVGAGKKGPPAAGLTGPPILPAAPSEGGRSIPLEVPLGPAREKENL